MASRGICNNNPGNIRWSSKNDWKGQCGKDADGFAKFTHMKYGIRALVRLIRNYYCVWNCYSVGKIIQRFAPASENPTQNYIKYVLQCIPSHIRPLPWHKLNYDEFQKIFPYLINAITVFESGYDSSWYFDPMDEMSSEADLPF